MLLRRNRVAKRRSWTPAAVITVGLVWGAPAESQVLAPPSNVRAPADVTRPWEPLGMLPVDQAGAGLRGYSIPGEGAETTAAGRAALFVHGVASNSFHYEGSSDIIMSQRYETHTLALGYRRGFQVGRFPRFELGGQLQLNQRSEGVLNGFIVWVEDVWAMLANQPSARNERRTDPAALPPLGTSVLRNGGVLYRDAGNESGLGDVSLVAKVSLRDSAQSGTTGVAARVVANIGGRSHFTRGNFIGAGLSVDTKLRERVALHGDVRGTLILDGESVLNLPLRHASVGFSAGPELRLMRNTSLSLQIDGSSSPYQSTGAVVFDGAYGAITLGLGHRFTAGSRTVVAQLYARENMNLPFRVQGNADPDFATGLLISIR